MEPKEMDTVDLLDPVRPDDHARGSASALVTLLEYGDFECPFCARAVPVIRELERLFGEDLKVVFRHNPRVFDHPHARKAAEAAEAAASEGKFWEMHDLLFAHQRSLDLDDLVKYASQIGLNPESFEHDLLADVHRAKVHEDELSGVRQRIISTPTFFINGRRFTDSPELDKMTRAVEDARLAAGGKPLNAAQRTYLRSLLEAKLRDLLGQSKLSETIRTVRDDLADPMDAATLETDRGDDHSLEEHERMLFEEVQHALRKFEDGTYGLSEESGEAIPFSRLKSIPWARHTVQEEEVVERERRNFATP